MRVYKEILLNNIEARSDSFIAVSVSVPIFPINGRDLQSSKVNLFVEKANWKLWYRINTEKYFNFIMKYFKYFRFTNKKDELRLVHQITYFAHFFFCNFSQNNIVCTPSFRLYSILFKQGINLYNTFC